MNQSDIFIGRQPILDKNENVVGYELLFRSAESLTANITDYSQAAASVFINIICGFGQDVLGKQKGFINVNEEMLMSDSIELLPREQVVIELLETVNINSDVIDRCRFLKKTGFSIALDDFSYTPECEPMLEHVDIVKMDIHETNPASIAALIKNLKQRRIKLLAEKVETAEQFKRYKEMDFDLFQGYYFARPVILNRKNIDISKLHLLKLLEQVLTDVDTKEIEETFKQNPTLSYNLLRLVNSVAMGLKHKVSTINHALLVVGRRNLKRWIQLLLFTHGTTGPSNSPLMHMAVMRGKMMELLIQSQPNSMDYADLGFMTGILSLLDTLLSMPMEEIVEEISLKDEVKQALLYREGQLGRLLMLCEKLEAGDFTSVYEILKGSNFTLNTLTRIQIEAMKWTNSLAE